MSPSAAVANVQASERLKGWNGLTKVGRCKACRERGRKLVRIPNGRERAWWCCLDCVAADEGGA